MAATPRIRLASSLLAASKRDTWLQPPDHREVIRAQPSCRRPVDRLRGPRVHVDRPDRGCRGHDAHDGPTLSVHANCGADDIRIGAEGAPPHALVEHQGPRARLEIARVDRPSGQGRDAEHVEEGLGDRAHAHLLRIPLGREVALAREQVEAGERLEGLRVQQIDVVARRNRIAAGPAVSLDRQQDERQALLRGEGESGAEHGPGHAEDRRIGADAERERQHRRRGHERRAPHEPKCETQVPSNA